MKNIIQSGGAFVKRQTPFLYDEETGENDWKPVVRLFRNQTKEWYHVFANGEEIVCTAEHPFYVVGEGFVEAKDLKISDKLLLSSGKRVIIEKLEVETLETAETTYNFEVADFHTYYVSESNVLVHNSCRAKNKIKPDSNAQGGHTVIQRDLETNQIIRYATYEPNPLNPSGFDEVLRVDLVGGSHTNSLTGVNIPVPHVHGKNILGGVRPALLHEIPKKWRIK